MQQKNLPRVTASESWLPVLPQVLARVRRLFDLYCDPCAVYEGLRAMDELRPGLRVLGTRVPGFPSPQDIAALGEEIEERLRSLGINAARSRTVYALAQG